MAVERKTVVLVDCAPWFGGAQRSFCSLALGLSGSPYTVVLVGADNAAGGLNKTCARAAIPCHSIAAHHWRRSVPGLAMLLWDTWRARLTLRAILQEHQPCFVHANGIRAAVMCALALPRDTTLLVHSRDLRAPALLQRLVARRAQRVVAISECVGRSWGASHSPTHRVTVVHNGIDMPAQVIPATGCRWDHTHLIAANVADMVSWKRHELFLQAIRTAVSSCSRLRGILVGRPLTPAGAGRLRALRTEAQVLGVDRYVQFVTDDDDALPWMAAADLLVSTADREPFGRAVLEALNLGKPVVATDGWGPGEILADCPAGTLVPGTAHDVATGILSWQDAAKRAHVVGPARSRAREFSVERMVAGVCRTYASLDGPADGRGRG